MRPAARTPWPQAQQLREQAQQRLEEEAAATAAAEAASWEATRQQRETQALLERSSELRALREKLRAAEVNYERVQQREQHVALAAREHEYAAALEAAMAEQCEAAAAREVEEAAARRAAGAAAREALDRQLQERSQLQHVAKVSACPAGRRLLSWQACLSAAGAQQSTQEQGRHSARASTSLSSQLHQCTCAPSPAGGV